MKKSTKEKLGIICAFFACVLFWLPIYEVNTFFLFFPTGKESIHLIPKFASGLWALVVVFLLYIRGIITFKTKKIRLISILINWALFSTFIEIFISPTNKNAGYGGVANNFAILIFSIVFISIIIFSVKEIAKLALLFFLLGSFFSNIMLVSDSMGVWGFVTLSFIIVSFYLQGNINMKTLEVETRYLFLNSKSQNIKLIEDAKKEARITPTKVL